MATYLLAWQPIFTTCLILCRYQFCKISIHRPPLYLVQEYYVTIFFIWNPLLTSNCTTISMVSLYAIDFHLRMMSKLWHFLVSRMQGAKRKLLDLANTFGLSNTVMRLIEKRTAQVNTFITCTYWHTHTRLSLYPITSKWSAFWDGWFLGQCLCNAVHLLSSIRMSMYFTCCF